MKRRILFGLMALLLFCLPSCQKLEERKTSAPEQTTVQESVSVKVTNPLTWERIEAIPVATSDMTSDQLRKICTDFMRLQLTFEWTPSKNVEYVLAAREKQMKFYAGRVYGGLPYRSFNANGNPYTMMEFYDPETGVLEVGKYTGHDLAGIIGNDCASAPFWAWNRVINSIRNFKDKKSESGFTNTGLIPENNLLPVGEYKSISGITWNDGDGTYAVCQENGEQVMYRSYAALLPADGLLHYYPANAGPLPSVNHLMMCALDPTVVYRADGSIDGEQSFVTILDQESNITTKRYDYGSVHYEGGVDVKFTFAELYRQSYVPFTFAEFLGLDPVEPAEAELLCKGDSARLDDLQKASVSANYAISHVKVIFTDEDGKICYDYMIRPTLLNTRELFLEKLFLPSAKTYADGKSLCRIEVQLGSGEVKCVFEGVLNQ